MSVVWFRYHIGSILAEKLPAQTAVSFTSMACPIENTLDPLQWTPKWPSSCAIRDRSANTSQLLTCIQSSDASAIQACNTRITAACSLVTACAVHTAVLQHNRNKYTGVPCTEHACTEFGMTCARFAEHIGMQVYMTSAWFAGEEG